MTYPYMDTAKTIERECRRFIDGSISMQELQICLYRNAELLSNVEWMNVYHLVVNMAEKIEYIIYALPENRRRVEADAAAKQFLAELSRLIA